MPDRTESEQSHPAVHAEQQLRRMNDAWADALVRRDTTTLDRLMDEACIFTDALTGDDKTQFIADIDSGDLEVNSLRRDNVEVRIYGATGIITSLDTADWRYKGRQIQGHYRTIHVYAERGGVWQIVAIQSSPIPMK